MKRNILLLFIIYVFASELKRSCEYLPGFLGFIYTWRDRGVRGGRDGAGKLDEKRERECVYEVKCVGCVWLSLLTVDLFVSNSNE